MGEFEAEDTDRTERRIGPTWRAFQVIGFIAAVTYIIGWAVNDPSRYLVGNATLLQSATGVVAFLSPIVALIMIGLAVSPESFRPLTQHDTVLAKVTLGAVLVLTALWLVNGLVFTPMYTKFVTTPLNPSMVVPIPGGVALHMIFQHWFMSFSVIALVLNPDGFKTITESETPAGLQCAVVEC